MKATVFVVYFQISIQYLEVICVYNKISFGRPINYDEWLLLIKNRLIIFDSGMHAGNKRPYSMWRATNSIWETMIIDSF
jgi:hypothetical protein